MHRKATPPPAMNPLPRRTFLGLSLGLAGAPSILTAAPTPLGTPPAAAGGKEEELLKFKKCEIATQKAPEFALKGTTDKRFKAKDWLEIEFEIDVKAPKGSTKDVKFLDDVTIKYYVFLQPADEKKKVVLMADVSYVNVPVDETIHSVVYLSNATLYNISGDKLVHKGLITYYGAEAFFNGKPAGSIASMKIANAPWWENPNLPPVQTGRLLPKHKTPFAPLWYDYYMEEKTDK